MSGEGIGRFHPRVGTNERAEINASLFTRCTNAFACLGSSPFMHHSKTVDTICVTHRESPDNKKTCLSFFFLFLYFEYPAKTFILSKHIAIRTLKKNMVNTTPNLTVESNLGNGYVRVPCATMHPPRPTPTSPVLVINSGVPFCVIYQTLGFS